MSPAITKTISLLLLITIGYLFRNRIGTKDQRDGIKTLILSLALPATIFIALLQIDFRMDMIVIPLLALLFNIVLFVLLQKIPLQTMFGIPESQYRSLVMLIPSLAPGLSCFPFIMEYSGQEPVALAALADVGNKVFVLVILYTMAMKWYYSIHEEAAPNAKGKLKALFIAMVNEPVNLVIITAIALLTIGLNYSSFPEFITLSIDRLSLMMTPLVLLFIGLSVRLTLDQVRTIFSFLFFRAGLAFFMSGLLLLFLPVESTALTLLIIVFPQSACSFWPYAHMAAVGQLEKKNAFQRRTFDLDFAMNVLACSMPFSVLLIMAIYSFSDLMAGPAPVFVAAVLFILAGGIIVLVTSRLSGVFRNEEVKINMEIQKTSQEG